MNWRLHGSMGCLEISMQTLVIHKLVCFTVDCNSFVWFISIWPSDPIFFFVLRREHARILLERKEKKIWVIHSNITFSLRTGWDTDQFMTDIAEATLVMSSVVKNVSGMNLLLMIICLSITCLGFFFYIQGNAVIFMSLINWLHLILLTGWTCTWWIQLWCQIVSAHWYFFLFCKLISSSSETNGDSFMMTGGGKVLMLRTYLLLISQEWTPWLVASATSPS
jgi:hypothetical protein